MSWVVIFLVRNCASTCANHKAGSFGQNGGTFKLTAATGNGAGAWEVEGVPPVSVLISPVVSTGMITT